MQGVAPSMGVDLTPLSMQQPDDIEAGVAAFARRSNAALIVTLSGPAIRHRRTIVALAARYRLPTIYPYRFFALDGGLMSYGPDYIEQFRSAVGYLDRVLRGDKPDDLPVQVATKYQLVINLKTAKVLGLDVPPSLLARADEVIE